MTQRLANKRALITGGGTGIGRGIALALAGEGCQVIVAGRRREPLEATAAAFSGTPAMLIHEVDVADRSSVTALFDWIKSEVGPLDILVNNAGINIPNRRMDQTKPEDWDRVLAVNTTGVFNCLHAALPEMRARGDGLVVNVSSVAGKRPIMLGGAAYCASKFATAALGATAGIEAADDGVRITTIYPGEVATPILDNRPVPVSQEQRERMLQPEDLGAAVLMVACLPPRAHVTELVMAPTVQKWA
jgi:NADP-dependent 3-hydroxy acid dehydrogenase YdfG